MPAPKDARVVAASLFYLPIATRVPLKFGPETLTHVTCLRVRLTVADSSGRKADGWGETPLSVQWAWPGSTSIEDRLAAMQAFSTMLAEAWCSADLGLGHPILIGSRFLEEQLPGLADQFNAEQRAGVEPMPRLASLICASAFDVALHDAYGVLNAIPTYRTYGPDFMKEDLGAFLESNEDGPEFSGQFPSDYLIDLPPKSLPAWHLVGGKDPIEPGELTGEEPNDGYPVLLRDWIIRDGLKCLKIKLRGDDEAWDFDRVAQVGRIAEESGVEWLSTDFNCTVNDPEYVNAILDRLKTDEPTTFERILYVEQPFPYDLEANRIDVHSVSGRKPLFMDEKRPMTGG